MKINKTFTFSSTLIVSGLVIFYLASSGDDSDKIALLERQLATLTTDNSRLTESLQDSLNYNDTVDVVSDDTFVVEQVEPIKKEPVTKNNDESELSQSDYNTDGDTTFVNNVSTSIEDRLLYETVDEKWNKEVTTQVTKVFDSIGKFGSNLVTSECKTSICKLNIEHADMDSHEFFNQKFGKRLNWDGDYSVSSYADDKGKIHTAVYLQRENENNLREPKRVESR